MENEILKERIAEMLSNQLTTWDFYFELYDDFEPERDDLHDSIIHSIFSEKKYSRNKQIFMLGGAPANGKSSFMESGIIKYPDTALKIDPDKIKELLPEYNYLVDQNNPEAAAIVHEESSYISKTLRKIAIEEGIDLILDGVANDSFEKRKDDLEALKINGHKIRIDYVTLETELSLKLAEIRFAETGRLVPETFIRETNRNFAKLIPQIIENQLFEELYLWDTNIKAQPRLILSQKNGKLQIESKALYDNFKKKENE